MRLHREGYKYILIATILWGIIGYLTWRFMPEMKILSTLINLAAFLVWFWIIWFFRIPLRTFTMEEQSVIAPADGKVVVIEETDEPEYFKDRRLQVSIFMSPLNVHVNRVPIDGVVKYMKYHPGKYLVAWHPKSSTENERTTVVIENPKATILLRQIAGAMARRIRWYVKEGQEVKQHEEFGFIRFGSRVDVFFPAGTRVDVKIGQVVKGGITVLAQLP